jgi:aminoglycoside phosphotransferase (APT) family kinase protein
LTAAPPALDAERLGRWLAAHVPGAEGPLAIEPVAGGQSNPTFFVTAGARRLVVRKKPAGALLPSAHAVDREHRAMAALAGTGAPVPRMLGYEPDPGVLGTPFYAMERLEGRVFADCAMPGAVPAERRAMWFAAADALAALHRVDWEAVGLADFGRPGRYFERQVERWSRQWALSRTRELPEIDRIAAWLRAHVPADGTTAIAHGDFRIGNLLFHPTEPRVVGVLDWELATLGHPLADAAYCALAWRLLPEEYMGMRGLDHAALGIPTEAEFLARYHASAPEAGRVAPFHTAFALFRLAVIFEGIAARARSGVAAAADAARVGTLSAVFARRALEALGA